VTVAPSQARERTTGRWSWIDLRLVPVAASIWIVCLAAPRCPRSNSPAVLRARRPGRSSSPPRHIGRPGSAAATVLLAVLAGVAVAAATGAVRAFGEGGLAAAAGRRVRTRRSVRYSVSRGRPTAWPVRARRGTSSALTSRRSTTGEERIGSTRRCCCSRRGGLGGGPRPGEGQDRVRGCRSARRGRRGRRRRRPVARPLRSAGRRVCSGPPPALRGGPGRRGVASARAGVGRASARTGRGRQPGRWIRCWRRTSAGRV
jgi:hypothetical protein